MKIRTDFVTNSSSSSFIALSLENEVLNAYLETIGKSLGELTEAINQIFRFMAADGQDFNEDFEVSNVAELLCYLISHCAGEFDEDDDDCYDSWYGGGLKGFNDEHVEKTIEYIKANSDQINKNTSVADFHYEWIVTDDCVSGYKSFKVKDGAVIENIDDNMENEIVDWRSWMEWSDKDCFDNDFLREKAMIAPIMTVPEFVSNYKGESFKYYILDYKKNEFKKLNSRLQQLSGEKADSYMDADYVIFDYEIMEEWPDEEEEEEELEEIKEVFTKIIEQKAAGETSIKILKNITRNRCRRIN